MEAGVEQGATACDHCDCEVVFALEVVDELLQSEVTIDLEPVP